MVEHHGDIAAIMRPFDVTRNIPAAQLEPVSRRDVDRFERNTEDARTHTERSRHAAAKPFARVGAAGVPPQQRSFLKPMQREAAWSPF